MPKGSKCPRTTSYCNSLYICTLAHLLQNHYLLPFRRTDGAATKSTGGRSVSAKENIGSRKGRGPTARWGGFSGPIQPDASLHEKHGKTLFLPKGSKCLQSASYCNSLYICALVHLLQNHYLLPFRRTDRAATKCTGGRSVSAKENIGSRKGRGPTARWGGFFGPIQPDASLHEKHGKTLF